MIYPYDPTYADDAVVELRGGEDPNSVHCHALVRDTGVWRRCHAYTAGVRLGRPVCLSHLNAEVVRFPMEPA